MSKMVSKKDSYYLEYKSHGIYHDVLGEDGRLKTFKKIDSARKYALAMYRKNYYDLIAVQGGGEYLGRSKDGKPMYKGQTAGIIETDWSKRDSNTILVYRNYFTRKTYFLNKDGSLGKERV